jgi:hypothetical protein
MVGMRMPKSSRGGEQQKFKVFVSYSRRDAEAADRIVAALESLDFAVTIDKRDLPYGEKWQTELAGFIKAADAVLFLVSPRSVGSYWCRWEIAQVSAQSKRLIPVVLEAVALEDLPPEVQEVHLLPWTPDAAGAPGIDELARILLTDRVWVQDHTRLADLAFTWLAEGRSPDRLLRGQALAAAEGWLSRRPAEAPPPSQVHLDFLAASQLAAKRRARRWVGGLSTVAVGALALAAVALIQRQVAVRNGHRATANEARSLAELSLAENSRGNATRALELAVQAYDTASGAGLTSDLAETALYSALWRQRELKRLTLDFDATDAWFDQPSGDIWAGSDTKLVVLDRDLKKKREAAAPPDVVAVESPLSAAERWGRALRKPTEIKFSWSADRGSITFDVPGTANGFEHRTVDRSRIGFDPRAAWLVAADEPAARVGVLIQGVVRGANGFDESRLVYLDERGTVAPINADDADSDFEIDPSGRLIVFGRGYRSAYFVRTNSPALQVQLHEYIADGDFERFRRSIRYSAKERVVSYVGPSEFSDLDQPTLMHFDTGVKMATLGGHMARVRALDLSSDGQTVVSLTADRTLRIWRLRVGADAQLVAKHRGAVLPGVYDTDRSSTTSSELHTVQSGPTYHALMRENGPLGREWFSFGLLEARTGDAVIAYSEKELIGFTVDDLNRPKFRRALSAPISRIVSDDGGATILTADALGRVIRWSRAGQTVATLLELKDEPILWMDIPQPTRDVIVAITPARVVEVPTAGGAMRQIAMLPGNRERYNVRIYGKYVSYCAGQQDKWDVRATHECELFSTDTQTVVLKTPCGAALVADERLGIAYCREWGGHLPALFDLSDVSQSIPVFPADSAVAASGLSERATISHAAVGPCRRAFISLGGGIADLPYRGQGLLYDFATKREIARTKGDPDGAYADYGGGAGLPVFCDGGSLTAYARELLVTIGVAPATAP